MQPMMMYLAGLVVVAAGDLLWLGVLMRSFYAARLGHLMAEGVTWWAALLFYLSYTFAVGWFVVGHSVSKGYGVLAMQGALFGVLAYAVYDLTNQATLKDWPVAVTVVDMAWGGFLTMLMALAMGWAAARG